MPYTRGTHTHTHLHAMHENIIFDRPICKTGLECTRAALFCVGRLPGVVVWLLLLRLECIAFVAHKIDHSIHNMWGCGGAARLKPSIIYTRTMMVKTGLEISTYTHTHTPSASSYYKCNCWGSCCINDPQFLCGARLYYCYGEHAAFEQTQISVFVHVRTRSFFGRDSHENKKKQPDQRKWLGQKQLCHNYWRIAADHPPSL